MIEDIKRVIAPISRRVLLMISRCTLNMVNDSTKTQSAQVELYDGEVHDDAQVWQQFGVSSVPPNGSEGIALFLGGERKTPLIIATENKNLRIIELESGEVVIYSGCGDTILLKSDNSIQIKTKKFSVESENVSIGSKDTELVDVLSQICQKLSVATTMTMMGPQLLSNSMEYQQLEQKLKKLKGEN